MSDDPMDAYAPRPHPADRPARHPTSVPAWATPEEHLPERAALPAGPAPGHHRDLRVLRRAYRRQRRVATFTVLGYFTLFLILSARSPDFMTRPVTGGLSTGMVLGLVQLPVTWLAIVLFEYTANRFVDPLARRMRQRTALLAEREPGR
ncbi:uncharacterized membrane protein (DUF485 family) [Streptomyces sp. V3I8]|jgi:uncharacterized membrane protein (DUF485 family)|uniref:DUF485 domain-containing protein n=1 Tax=Streptomyces sp. V3I8 TaxID=3042279 RepID=UPI00278873BB|nr:DUF485 domain-containing protein [Streptomyces sp. V3I8]MDQ1033882.1 uncharacterized membrane protein (DUF485 family) [Streptomyces sp. V3I8]